MTDLNTERQIIIWESRLHEAKRIANDGGPLAQRFHRERIEDIEGMLSLLRAIREEAQ
tara:strand:+ start:1729 stop:1902 length:174 start_codon:yes stop_codon:yes gene_type:complete